MRQLLSLLLCLLLLTGCTTANVVGPAAPTETKAALPDVPENVPEYTSRFDFVTEIVLSDEGILVDALDGNIKEPDYVSVTHDIIYYEDRDTYDSGNPYGEGTDADKHAAEEADAHNVVNITAPGAYRISGKLSAGQIRVDLGEDACEDPDAVVELILHNADITCTVAPAILFLNTYECDGSWSVDTAKANVDTMDAGANLILEGTNTVSGSYVARIYKDKDGEKKLWKQDGAIYSYMSMNVFGPGSLELTAANEGMDTELHLTINGGDLFIYSNNDGINTNEDDVSVTTINGGNLTIFAGLGAEGDGIDSNGYLVINGGTVISSAKPASDAGLDSSLGSFVNGGTVIAMGSAMDWAESDSGQVTMNLQFAQQQAAGAKITVTRKDGTEVFSFKSDSEYARGFSGLILSHAAFTQGETYHVFVDGVQMAYTGSDMGRGGPGGMSHGRMPEDFDQENMPEGFDPKNIPEGFDGEMPEMPQGGFGGRGPDGMNAGEPRIDFYMNDMVNFFSGVTAA